MRAVTTAAGFLLAVAAVPLVVVLPELGIPALLLALRLLAVEFDWAARCYAWVVWRWEQVRAWYRQRSSAVRALVLVALLAVAVALLWLLAHESLSWTCGSARFHRRVPWAG
jgi:hypothetical protein